MDRAVSETDRKMRVECGRDKGPRDGCQGRAWSKVLDWGWGGDAGTEARLGGSWAISCQVEWEATENF